MDNYTQETQRSPSDLLIEQDVGRILVAYSDYPALTDVFGDDIDVSVNTLGYEVKMLKSILTGESQFVDITKGASYILESEKEEAEDIAKKLQPILERDLPSAFTDFSSEPASDEIYEDIKGLTEQNLNDKAYEIFFQKCQRRYEEGGLTKFDIEGLVCATFYLRGNRQFFSSEEVRQSKIEELRPWLSKVISEEISRYNYPVQGLGLSFSYMNREENLELSHSVVGADYKIDIADIKNYFAQLNARIFNREGTYIESSEVEPLLNVLFNFNIKIHMGQDEKGLSESIVNQVDVLVQSSTDSLRREIKAWLCYKVIYDSGIEESPLRACTDSALIGSSDEPFSLGEIGRQNFDYIYLSSDLKKELSENLKVQVEEIKREGAIRYLKASQEYRTMEQLMSKISSGVTEEVKTSQQALAKLIAGAATEKVKGLEALKKLGIIESKDGANYHSRWQKNIGKFTEKEKERKKIISDRGMRTLSVIIIVLLLLSLILHS